MYLDQGKKIYICEYGTQGEVQTLFNTFSGEEVQCKFTNRKETIKSFVR